MKAPRRLSAFQAQAESMMTLTLRVLEPSGKTTDADGYEVQGYADQGTVRGKIQSSSRGGDTTTRYAQIGDVQRPILEGALHIPIDAEVPVPGWQRGQGWEYLVTGVCGSADPTLIGRRFLVVEVPTKSFATARRLTVVEVQ